MIGLLDREAGLLLAGVVGVLVLASVVTAVLFRVLDRERHDELLVNLAQRVAAWWAMIALVVGALALGETAVVLVFLAVALLGLREFITISPTTRRDHRTLVWLFFIIPPLQFWFVWEHWYGMFAIFIPVYAFLFLPATAALRGRTEGFLFRTASVQWMLMVCVYAVSHVPALLQLPIAMELGRSAAEGSMPGLGGGAGAALMMYLVIVVQGSDVLQYVWGKSLGKHAVAPTVSPNKTWEGLIGGVLSATALGGALWWATPFTPWQAALLSFVSCVMGFLGGLVMSSIKRDRGVKDFGTTISGHGGIMDRFDSLVFAAPVFFHLVRFFFA